MNSNPHTLPHSLEGLLAHADWVRALARRLVRDEAEADDVAQEVWREAVERPPRHDANPRGWLAAVARNAVRTLKRGDRRRDDRERASARSESMPSTAQLVEEASLSRELAGIVLQLDEPYRTTMLLRWFREMDVDAIAQALKLPRETVRTRLRRGLEMLREKLDAERGGRAAWLSAFAPLTRLDLVSSAATSGAIGGMWLWISLAAGVVVTTWIVASKPFENRDPDKIVAYEQDDLGSGYAIHESGKRELVEPGGNPAASTTRRAPIATTSAAPIQSAPIETTIEALVVDPDLRPIAGFVVEYRLRNEPYWEGDTLHTPSTSIEVPARVRALLQQDPSGSGLERSEWDTEPGVWETLTTGTPPRPRATSAADGLVRIPLPKGEWDRHFPDAQRTLVAVLHPPAGPESWVVAPCVRIAGVVVDEAHRPLAQGSVQLDVRWNRDASAPADVTIELHGSGIELDARGAFAIDRVPLGVPCVLRAWADGFQSWSGAAPDHEDLALEIVLRRSKLKVEPHVRGIVLSADGRPVDGATVQLGQHECRCDERGHFDLKVACCAEGRPLTASKRGHQPAILPAFGRATMTDTDGVVLRLGGKPLTIDGHVRDAKGLPIADCFIRLVEATQYGTTDLTLEALASESDDVRPRSSADGAFEIGGLLDREYTLIAWHEVRGFVARKEHVQAGAKDVELTLDPSAFVARVPGTLVDANGAPVPGARVALCFMTSGAADQHWNMTYGAATTDADGSFVLEDVPVREVGLWIQGEGLETIEVPMPEQPASGIRLVAKLLVNVRLLVADASVESIEFRDRDDRPCPARIHLPDVLTQRTSVVRSSGAFPPIELGEAAVQAVLKRGDGTIVRRAPITIRRAKELTLDL